MKRGDIITALKYIENGVIDRLPEILEPFKPFGKSIAIVIQEIRDGIQDMNHEKKIELQHKAKDALKDYVKEIKTPEYMRSVLFMCPTGCTMSEEQQDKLNAVLMREHESEEEQHLALMAEFISQYMGGNIEPDCVDEYSIGKDYLALSFTYDLYDEESYLPYDENDMKLVMKSLNALLGENVFDDFIIDGFDDEI